MLLLQTCHKLLPWLQRTMLAMTRVGIPPADQQAIFMTVAAILNMGNITFAPGPDESSVIADSKAEEHLSATGVSCTPMEGHI